MKRPMPIMGGSAMCTSGLLGYWWKFVTDPEFQEKQEWMQPVLRFFALLPPNVWTLMRIPGGVITCWLMYEGFTLSSLIVFLLFVLTDWADGKSARKRKQETANGGILDGTADKFLILIVVGYLVYLFSLNTFSYWKSILPMLFLLMVLSEISRVLMPLSGRFNKEKHFHAALYGKYKFGVQVVLAVMLWFAVFVFPFWPWWPIWICLFLAAAIVLSVFSFVFRLYPELERYAADVITLGNLSCGFLAILFAWAGEPKTSVALILIAGVLDMADGLVARKTKPPKEKPGLTFGGLADDIGDGVSFALAPAAILFFLDEYIVAVIYFLATIGRLWFFTDQERKGKSIPGVFRGVPSPAAAIFLGSFLLWEHPVGHSVLPFVSVALAGLEVLFIFKWYHFRLILRIPEREMILVGIFSTILFFFVGSGEALTALLVLYLVFFLYPVANARWDWDKI